MQKLKGIQNNNFINSLSLDIKNVKKKDKKEIKEKNSKKNKKWEKWEKKEEEPKLWRKIIFPISQFSGKIQKIKFNKKYLNNHLTDDDIDFILKTISTESRKFSPVRKNTKNKIIFILIFSILFYFSCYFFVKAKIFFGIIFICVFFILLLYYNCKVKKGIQLAYKKCRQKLFFITDFINRKQLGKLGLYLSIDSILRFIAIYRVPKHIMQVLEYRDEQIEFKKQFLGRTLNELHDKKKDTVGLIDYKGINSKSNNFNYIMQTKFNNFFNNKKSYIKENNDRNEHKEKTKNKENEENNEDNNNSNYINKASDKTIYEVDKKIKLDDISINIKNDTHVNIQNNNNMLGKQVINNLYKNIRERNFINFKEKENDKGTDNFYEKSQSKSTDIFINIALKEKGIEIINQNFNKKEYK